MYEITSAELDEKIAGRTIHCTDYSETTQLIVFSDDSYIKLNFDYDRIWVVDEGEKFTGKGLVGMICQN